MKFYNSLIALRRIAVRCPKTESFFCTVYNIGGCSRVKTLLSNELASSSVRIGKLYPVLVDRNGKIIDGAHRLRVDKNWPVLRLNHIETEKDRLIASIVSNVVRRTVSPKEKRQMVSRLGQVHFNEGTERGRISYKIAEETGMSYRWVSKYLPSEFKDSTQSSNACSASNPSSKLYDEFLLPPKRGNVLSVKRYRNTNFISLVLDRSFYEEFENDSLELGVLTEFSMLNALEQYHEKMKRAIATKNRSKQTLNQKAPA